MRAYRKVDDHYVFRIEGGRLALLGVGGGLVLVLVFLLGVLVGKALWGGRVPPIPLAEVPEAKPPAPEVPAPTQPELTFYDDLRKPGGEATAPLPAASKPDPAPAAPAPVPGKRAAPSQPAAPPPSPAPAPEATPAEVPPPAPKPPPRKEPEPRLPAPVFTVQVGSFRDRTAAESLARTINAQGVNTEVIQASVAGRTWYRVQVGRFETRSEAEGHYRNRLKPRGIQGFVTTR